MMSQLNSHQVKRAITALVIERETKQYGDEDEKERVDIAIVMEIHLRRYRYRINIYIFIYHTIERKDKSNQYRLQHFRICNEYYKWNREIGQL